ncbi:MAG: hypothetical protein CMP11_07080 [Zetaproteobacteria bacterium]|nr:hypothetical protein [Pseudobdellovibrionaceae bacterium]|tara:strand:- start:979 stop:2463 length:1485 start_codon:yes stop_codon:yes gene_type:complete
MKVYIIFYIKIFVMLHLLNSRVTLSLETQYLSSYFKNQDSGIKKTSEIKKINMYDILYPYYIKYCSTTKYHPREGKGLQGTIAGHGVFYLKGVCKNNSLSPSGLSICEKERDYTDKNLGVGISVSKGLKNVSFFVFPSWELFFFPPINKNSTFDLKKKNEIIESYLKDNIFKDIEFHDFMFPKTLINKHKEKFIAHYTFGSDYALALARNVYCINIPTNRKIMEKVVLELNHLDHTNRSNKGENYRGFFFRGTKKDNSFHWHGVFDNCIHPIVNILHRIGLLKEKKSNRPLTRQIFNIPIPSNTILDIHKAANLKKIDIDHYYNDPKKKETFVKYRWISQQAGVVSEKIGIFEDNNVYKENDKMFVFPHLYKKRDQQIRTLFKNPQFSYKGYGLSSIIPNLIYMKKIFKDAIEQTNKREKERKSKISIDNFTRIEQEIKNIEIKNVNLKKLKKLKNDLDSYKTSKKYIDFLSKFKKYLISEIEKIDYILNQDEK